MVGGDGVPLQLCGTSHDYRLVDSVIYETLTLYGVGYTFSLIY